VAWGDKGSSPITVQQSQVGNIDLHGLVLNHAIQVLREPAPPVIDVIAANGDVAIDGGHVVLGQFTVSGTRYDLTSGLLTLSRDPDAVGRIAIQASGNVSVSRDLSGAPPKPPSFAAVATAITSGTPRGGVIRVRALQGGIQARDRAFQADGAGDNASALIELVADGDIAIESPSTADPAHAPTLTVAARTVNGIGRGGTVVLQSCQGDVTVGAGARVLATGPSAPGISRFTGKTVSINGVVNPPPTAGPTCEVPAPLF